MPRTLSQTAFNDIVFAGIAAISEPTKFWFFVGCRRPNLIFLQSSSRSKFLKYCNRGIPLSLESSDIENSGNTMASNFTEIASFTWSVADLLRGDYKQSDYGKVILPFTLLRRMDCVLDATKAAVLKEVAARKDQGIDLKTFLTKKAAQSFYNTSPFDFAKSS